MRPTTLLTAAAALALPRLLRQRRAVDFQGRVVVITGARGLALELARIFAAEGARLALLARDEDELDAARADLADAEVRTYRCDVRDREAVEQTIQAVVDEMGGLDVLINNAGVIGVGPLEHQDEAAFRNLMEIHTWGAFNTIMAARPHLAAAGRGRIVNIASIGGVVAVPHLLPYSTSKFALVGLSDGLRAELRAEGIRVTTVCPGLMRTGSHVRARTRGQHEREYAWFALSNAFPLLSMAADKSARKIVEACRYGDARLTLSLPAKLAVGLNAVAPGTVAAAMALAARLLPNPTGPEGDQPKEGWHSRSELAPAALTWPSDRVIPRNNEDVGVR